MFKSALPPEQELFHSSMPPEYQPHPQVASEFVQPVPPVDQSHEALKTKDRMITQLQEEKRKLETELGEWRSKMFPSKVVEKPTVQAKAFEAWQIAGVLILAVFLGYFLGTK